MQPRRALRWHLNSVAPELGGTGAQWHLPAAQSHTLIRDAMATRARWTRYRKCRHRPRRNVWEVGHTRAASLPPACLPTQGRPAAAAAAIAEAARPPAFLPSFRASARPRARQPFTSTPCLPLLPVTRRHHHPGHVHPRLDRLSALHSPSRSRQ